MLANNREGNVLQLWRKLCIDGQGGDDGADCAEIEWWNKQKDNIAFDILQDSGGKRCVLDLILDVALMRTLPPTVLTKVRGEETELNKVSLPIKCRQIGWVINGWF